MPQHVSKLGLGFRIRVVVGRWELMGLVYGMKGGAWVGCIQALVSCMKALVVGCKLVLVGCILEQVGCMQV